MPGDVLELLDTHLGKDANRSAYIAGAVRRALVADALAKLAAHNDGSLPYADELDGIEDEAA